MGDQAARPASRRRRVAGLLGGGRQAPERGNQCVAVGVAGAEDPVVVEPGQKFRVADRDGLLQITSR